MHEAEISTWDEAIHPPTADEMAQANVTGARLKTAAVILTMFNTLG